MALKKWFPVFVLPTLAAFTIVFAVPFILGLGLSFTEFTTVLDAKWVAFENYIKAFSNRDFLNALWFTVKFCGCVRNNDKRYFLCTRFYFNQGA